MAKIVLYMSMSLDGFIAGPGDGADHPLGLNGSRLHEWFSEAGTDPASHRPSSGPSAQVFGEMLATGAVITGRRTFDIAHQWGGDHHDGVQIFALTRTVPGEERWNNVHYVTDGIESCVAQAKAAAGDRSVLLHGAYTAQECLRAGLLDELEIALIPVLLGGGRRLFENLGGEHLELELTRNLQTPTVTHLRYRVRKA